ncbi:MAG: acyltransferase [Deltaproteobacteria bacterium]|nr:acyltransferase [Deltaproteobacteria bacterium]
MTTTHYRPDIDGLRAVAVLFVLFFHLFPGRLPGGYVGVDVFFVISGFLITQIISRELDDGRFRITTFYARRVKRIFPALLVMLVFALVVGYLGLFTQELKSLGLHVASGAAFFSNVTLYLESGYFDTAAESKPLLHLWSLGVEEQFYIAWPWIALLVKKAEANRRGAGRWGLVVLAVASFVCNVVLTRTNPTASFYLPFSRFWELAIGGLLALSPGTKLPPGLSRVATVVGVGLLVASAFVLDRTRLFPGFWALMPVLGSALLIHGGEAPGFLRRVISTRPLVFVGLISYPLYLWHWPIIVFFRAFGADPIPTWVKLILLALSVLLAWLTFALVERPIRSRSGASKVQVGLLAAGVFSAGALGLVAFLTGGAPWRGAAFVGSADTHFWPSHQESHYEEDRLATSLFGSDLRADRDFFLVPPDFRATRVAVLGDSHSNRVAVGLGVDRENADSVSNLGRGTCLPLWNVDAELANGVPLHCQPLTNRTIDLVGRSRAITDVVLTGYFGSHVDGAVRHQTSAQGAAGGRPASGADAIAAGLEATVRRLLGKGKRVILVAPAPEMPFPMSGCSERPLSIFPRREECWIALRDHLARFRSIIGLMERLSTTGAREGARSTSSTAPDVVLIRPHELFCDARRCSARDGIHPNYVSDGSHLTYRAARRLGAWMISRGIFRSRLVAPSASVE